jgi:N6-L-threonylcarbamoyladenine synthase
MKGNTSDFSFSGLKTAVLRWVQEQDMTEEIERRRDLLRAAAQPTVEQWLSVTPRRTLDLLASFQQTVVDELLRRIRSAGEDTSARTIVISGGVACNRGLREAAARETLAARVLFPTPSLSTDNAAMIAAAAFPKLARAEFADYSLAARANLALA